ncbi:maleylacetate reductase [Mesorhizobium sp. 1M-11]|uniref:maleylacetate reductase n=1 Tax=Mesorhizobium sp. 1M-11 TaxID=1529006 RepID=UPI0006C73E1D|nr:maleylacetate reductase [Mesorhizobium sp. 1M-11]
MDNFVCGINPARVIFGTGALSHLGGEASRLGIQRALIVTTSSQRHAEQAVSLLGCRAAGTFTGAKMHTPLRITDTALAALIDCDADGIVAIGGGAAIGLSKALALRTDLPQIVIPTTYSGSEMTAILGETDDGKKVTQTSSRILPEVVIYDVELTLSFPALLAGTSGLNAIAHAVEALYARDRNPVVDLLAVEGISALAKALPRIVEHPQDHDARALALYGAFLCGTCLGAVGMALHHKLCHTLGGLFDLPHAPTHAAVLPHAVAYNAPAVPQAMAKIAAALATRDAAIGLYDLAGAVGAIRTLADLGMPADRLSEVVCLALQNPYWNPRPLEPQGIRFLLEHALAGRPPQPD